MNRFFEKLSSTERAALAELKEILARQFDVQDIRLFGSRARGMGSPESDLDLFIVLSRVDWEIEKAIYTLCFELSVKYNLLLAPVLYSRAEIEDSRIQATPFYRVIQREGLPL